MHTHVQMSTLHNRATNKKTTLQGGKHLIKLSPVGSFIVCTLFPFVFTSTLLNSTGNIDISRKSRVEC